MNLKSYWAKDYTGRPFVLFGAAHWAVLAAVAALNFTWVWLGPHLDEDTRLAMRVTLAIILLIVGGLFILIGYRASAGAMMILIYWVPVTFIVHSFWNDPVPERRMQSIQFMKNIAIIGGLMIILVNGSGRFSIKRLIAASRPPKTKW